MGEAKGHFKWAVGILVGLIAAGGGGTAWLSYFQSSPADTPQSNPWDKAQPLFFASFDLQYENPELWPVDEAGFWQRELKNGVYCFTNRQGEDEVDFHYLEIEGASNAELPAAVDVQTRALANTEAYSSTGLLYRYDPERRYYYAVTLTVNGQLNVYKRNHNGYNTLYAGPAESFKTGESNRLGVIGQGARLHIYLNDRLLQVVHDEEFSQGAAGLVAIGTGAHCFDKFGIYESVAALPE